jgi:hypothetical protein
MAETSLGKRVKCPGCQHVFPARQPDDAPDEPEREERVTEQPPAARRTRVAVEDEEQRVTASVDVRKARRAEPEEADDDEPAPKRRKKKSKKKRPRPDSRDEDENPAWPWWVFGGGAIFLTMFGLLCMALFTPDGNPMRFYALYLLIVLPISAVVFIVAMFLSSITLGAVEVGELHVAFVKGFLLLFVVNLVNLMPGGIYLSLFIWVVGLMTLFRLDFWEARMLVVFNWVLNWLIRFLVFVAFLHWMHGD